MILGQRRSRLVATIWGLVGLGFVSAGVILWVDTRRLAFELPAATLAFVLALAWWRQRAVIDRHGIRTVRAFREHRLLWAGIDHVEVRRPSWFRAALVLVPKGGRPPIPVPASAGLQRRQRNRMVELLTDLSRQHGFDVVMPTGTATTDATGPGAADPAVPAATETAHLSGRPAGDAAVAADRPAVAGGADDDLVADDRHDEVQDGTDDPGDEARGDTEGPDDEVRGDTDDPGDEVQDGTDGRGHEAQGGSDGRGDEAQGGTDGPGDERSTGTSADEQAEPAWLALLDPPAPVRPPDDGDEPVPDERLVPESSAADDPERDDPARDDPALF